MLNFSLLSSGLFRREDEVGARYYRLLSVNPSRKGRFREVGNYSVRSSFRVWRKATLTSFLSYLSSNSVEAVDFRRVAVLSLVFSVLNCSVVLVGAVVPNASGRTKNRHVREFSINRRICALVFRLYSVF